MLPCDFLHPIMRQARFKAAPEASIAYYHCVSRVVDRRFILARRFVVRKYAFRLLGGAALAAVVFTAPAAISAQSEGMVDTLEEIHRVAGNPGDSSIYRT